MKRFLRPFRDSPGFAAAVIVPLALGIGANSAIFSLINAIPFEAPPIPGSKSDCRASGKLAYGRGRSTEILVLAAAQHPFRDITAHWLDYMNLTGTDRPELIAVARATTDFFRLYGAPVLYGRSITQQEDRPGGGRVVVLSARIWKDRFESDPAIVGRSISLGGMPYAVIGILAPFDAELFDQAPDVWVPFQLDPDGRDKDGRLCYVTARLKPGVTLAGARSEMEALARVDPGTALRAE